MEEVLELLRHTADGAYIINEQQRFVFWNASAEELLGYSAEEVLGRRCYEVLAGRDEGECAVCRHDCAPFVASGQGEPVSNFDVRVRTKTGERRWLNVSIIAVPGTDDGPRGVIHLVRDVDAKKQAETFAREIALRAQALAVQPPVSAAVINTGEALQDLTPRELQVLQLLVDGADTDTIAQELMISKATVRNHIQHILHKLGVHSRLEAVAYAREHGFT